jgi:surface protein
MKLLHTPTARDGVTGTYTIRIRGTYDAIQFSLYYADGDKILSLDQWGTQSWTSIRYAFLNAYNLTIPATDTPNFSAVIDMNNMFGGAILANPDTSGWDTSAVTDMNGMFRNAPSANPDTSGWNTSAVTDMGHMFNNATSANPDTSGWDTSAVRVMTQMFWGATSFDQDIGSWDVTSLRFATEMFTGVTLSTPNYDSLLIGWSKQVLQPGVFFSGGNSTYCTPDAIAARASMIASDSWLITDGGQSCPPDDTCNVKMVWGDTVNSTVSYVACEILVLGPSFTAANGSNLSANSGWVIAFLPGFKIEQGATLNANVCGQSLCLTSLGPMTYGCHSCVDQICDIDPSCCGLMWDAECLGMMGAECGLVCE